MGRRQDGRIEPGQSLKSAISARAWNRAQDAADIVLGQQVSFGAEAGIGSASQLVVPVRVTTEIDNVGVGHVVQIMGAVAAYELAATDPDIRTNPTSYEAPRIFGLRGRIPLATQFLSTAESFQRPDLQATGVIVGGVTMPTIAQPQVVQVCISGVCIARVIRLGTPSNSFGFVQPAVVRDLPSGQTQQNLAGVYEPADFGVHRLLRFATNSRVLVAGQTEITWGIVIL